jgi:hypothetical protein
MAADLAHAHATRIHRGNLVVEVGEIAADTSRSTWDRTSRFGRAGSTASSSTCSLACRLRYELRGRKLPRYLPRCATCPRCVIDARQQDRSQPHARGLAELARTGWYREHGESIYTIAAGGTRQDGRPATRCREPDGRFAQGLGLPWQSRNQTARSMTRTASTPRRYKSGELDRT